MNVQYFALSRIEFISNFYKVAVAPFIGIKSQIEEGKPPYETPSYYEYSEPPFLAEWIAADQSIDILGLQSASLLSSTLKLYLKESLINVFRRNSRKKTKDIKTESEYKSSFKKGWLNGYKDLFENELGQNWTDSQVNLDILEELILARNRGQHPEDLVLLDIHYSKSDLEKIDSPFFIDEVDFNKDEYSEFMPPYIKPTPEKIMVAIEEIIKLVRWLDEQLVQWERSP